MAGDGTDTIGLVTNGSFYLRNANTSGVADLTVGFGGDQVDLPVAGNWDGVPSMLPPTVTPSPTPVVPPAMNASFVYDGDGDRVKSTINGATTYFVGAHYEVANGVVTKYYYAGSQRIAMRTNGTLNYLLGDHLGSTSLTTDANGYLVSEMRYKAWGEVRYASGTTSTKYQYTGQASYEADFGLYYYGARWYDFYLNHFTQPDTIVPDPYNPQDWDRYSYARNNPIRYTDPNGHFPCPWCVVGAAVYLVNMSLHLGGVLPDYEGIATTVALTDTKDATVAAGLSFQSEYPWSIFLGGGKGLAQLTSAEMNSKKFGMEGEDPYSSSVAVEGMEKRIQIAENDCKSCTTGYDRLLVAAMAQNGSVTGLDNFGDLPVSGNTIDWNKLFFKSPDIGNSGSSLAQLRAGVRDEKYSTLFMVRLIYTICGCS